LPTGLRREWVRRARRRASRICEKPLRVSVAGLQRDDFRLAAKTACNSWTCHVRCTAAPARVREILDDNKSGAGAAHFSAFSFLGGGDLRDNIPWMPASEPAG